MDVFTELWRIASHTKASAPRYPFMTQDHRKSTLPGRLWRWVLGSALILVASAALHAQKGVTTFGIQIKPVIPFGYFEPVTNLNEGALSSTI